MQKNLFRSTQESTIYAYDTVAGGGWSKAGDLRVARNHAISVNHPNDWILTIGGLRASDKMANIVELYDPSTGDSIDTGLKYSRKNEYRATYRYDASTDILLLWGGMYESDNVRETG